MMTSTGLWITILKPPVCHHDRPQLAYFVAEVTIHLKEDGVWKDEHVTSDCVMPCRQLMAAVTESYHTLNYT